jgi:hypothetical protein
MMRRALAWLGVFLWLGGVVWFVTSVLKVQAGRSDQSMGVNIWLMIIMVLGGLVLMYKAGSKPKKKDAIRPKPV